MKFFIIVMSLLSLTCSMMGQVTKTSDDPVVASPSPQADAQAMPTNVVTSSEEPKTSSPTAESNTNEVAPTDPAMIPPPASTENATNVPLPMDPNAGSTTETPSEEVSPVNSTESIEKKKHEIKVHYNEVRTQVEKEEAVAALRQAADKATTPEGERQTLKAYYELLFKRMKQVDPSLTERCDVMQGAYLRRLEQKGIEPTIPLSLPSRDTTNTTNASTPPATKRKLHKKISTSNADQ